MRRSQVVPCSTIPKTEKIPGVRYQIGITSSGWGANRPRPPPPLLRADPAFLECCRKSLLNVGRKGGEGFDDRRQIRGNCAGLCARCAGFRAGYFRNPHISRRILGLFESLIAHSALCIVFHSRVNPGKTGVCVSCCRELRGDSCSCCTRFCAAFPAGVCRTLLVNNARRWYVNSDCRPPLDL